VEGTIGSDGSFAPWTVRWAIAEGAV
jgi:hypothetical protein